MGGVFALISNKEPSLKEKKLQKEVISVSSYSNRLSNAFSANDFLPNGRNSKKTNNIFYLSYTNEYENKLYSLDNSMGYMNISNQKFSWLLFFALLLPLGLLAQSEQTANNKEAEELFASTFPLGIYISGKTFSYKEKGDSGLFNHNYSSVWMPDIGLTYNFYQKNRFNLNSSIGGTIFKEYYFDYSFEENIYDLNSYPSDKLLLHLDITGEYIFYNYRNTSLSLHIGYELLYDGSIHKQINTRQNPNSTGTVELLTDYSKTEFTHGINLGIGAYQKLGNRLIKLELNYHIHTSKLIQNRLVATDFPNHPDVDHSVNWNGNHISAKATFYPFKRSKK